MKHLDMHRKVMFGNPEPSWDWQSVEGWSIYEENFFPVWNGMKYPDLHRKVMFVNNPTPYEG